MDYRRELELAINTAKKVGNFLNSQFEKTVELAEGRDIKLYLDKKSEDLIVTELSVNSDFSILSEECGLIGEVSTTRPCWIIDPIDGTLNYSRDLPIACVSIALWVDKTPILGVVYDFYRDELFHSLVSDRKAYLNGEEIIPSRVENKSEAILATGFPTYMVHSDENLLKFIQQAKEYKKIRMLGSAALSLCYVASGRVDSYKENNIKIWDVAAGIALNTALAQAVSVAHLENYNTSTSVGI